MAKLIFGITGEMGSGKGVVSKYIEQKYKAGKHRFSTMLRDVLKRMYIEESRENTANLSLTSRKNCGEDVFAKTMYHDVEKDEHDIVVIDGVRRMADIVYLKDLPYFKLIYIDADLEARYKRVVDRDENDNDSEKTLDDFKKDQELESEAQISDLRNYAEHIVDNNGTYRDLYGQIDEIIKQYLK